MNITNLQTLRILSLWASFMLVLNTSIIAQCPKLIWADEFDGTALDLTKWSYQTGDGCDINLCQWGNNELQWYSQDNVQVTNGTLKIIAKQQTVQNRSYTSGRIRTINKGDIKFGRIEARMKMPIGRGIWPALWLLPTENVYGVWPQSGEIDMMEYLGHEPASVQGTIHYGNVWPNNLYSGKTFTMSEGDFTEKFHDFALEWTENDIKWFVDGYLYSTKTKSDLGSFRWPFDQKFHFLINMAVGGTLPGNPNSSTVFPQTFEVDYVRVYDLTGAPYLSGKQKVEFMEKSSAYSLVNVPTGSTIKWTVPAGATIVSGNDTKDILVNWGTIGGKITATITNNCGESKFELAVNVEASFKTSIILENFDTEGKITQASATGTFTDNTATPSPNAVNSSALCGKYVRNSSQQYDVLFYNVADVTNGADFTSGEKRFYIDLNTNAPIGTTLLLQLENKNLAQGSYPAGRHSRFTATTTKQNEWERLVFQFTDRPDANLSNSSINQMVMLFASNTFTGHTYYFDNFEIYAKSTTAISESEKQFKIQFSPNPVSDLLSISTEVGKNMSSIDIIDVSGKAVANFKNINNIKTEINTHTLPNGLYYISINFENGLKATKAFVKQ